MVWWVWVLCVCMYVWYFWGCFLVLFHGVRQVKGHGEQQVCCTVSLLNPQVSYVFRQTRHILLIYILVQLEPFQLEQRDTVNIHQITSLSWNCDYRIWMPFNNHLDVFVRVMLRENYKYPARNLKPHLKFSLKITKPLQ